jgi:arylsulfatase A
MIDFSDTLPTLADLAGAQLPNGVTIDGRSFTPQLRGEKGSPREWVFTQLGHRRFARDGHYLLHDDGRLYNVTADLVEKHDLSASTQSSATAAKKRLQSALDHCK